MKDLLMFAVVIALAAAFIILLAGKWGFLEWVQINGNEIFAKLCGCNFCLSFWVGFVLSTLFAIVTGSPVLLFVPFIQTPLTRFIL